MLSNRIDRNKSSVFELENILTSDVLHVENTCKTASLQEGGGIINPGAYY